MFERIDGHLIRNTILWMDGAAGPSGLDTAAWKRMYTSFKEASADLCKSIALQPGGSVLNMLIQT